VHELARQLHRLASLGLQRRALSNAHGEDERFFLEPVAEIVREGRTVAEEMLTRYRQEWGASTDPLFREYAF